MSVQFATCILEPGVLYACILKQNSRYLRGGRSYPNPSASSCALAFCRDSCHSFDGSLSATMPAPT